MYTEAKQGKQPAQYAVNAFFQTQTIPAILYLRVSSGLHLVMSPLRLSWYTLRCIVFDPPTNKYKSTETLTLILLF